MDYVLATLVGGGLTLNVKRQLELKFAHLWVPAPPASSKLLPGPEGNAFKVIGKGIYNQGGKEGMGDAGIQKESSQDL